MSTKKYEVLNYTFLGVNTSLANTCLYKYEISLNKSTVHTGRLFDGIAKGLNDLAEFFDTTLEECLSIAYNVISKRTGQTINGQFYKSSSTCR